MREDFANPLTLTFTLLVIFQIKHLVADYPLQTPYMLGKFKPGWDFLVPLLFHCAVHAAGTLLIVLIFAPSLWYLAAYDFVVHFAMDRIKAGPRYLGRFSDPKTTAYWTAFGFDQMVHHLTHYSIIYFIVTAN